MRSYSNENDFDLHENGRKGGSCTETRFETEAKGNSEMANWIRE